MKLAIRNLKFPGQRISLLLCKGEGHCYRADEESPARHSLVAKLKQTWRRDFWISSQFEIRNAIEFVDFFLLFFTEYNQHLNVQHSCQKAHHLFNHSAELRKTRLQKETNTENASISMVARPAATSTSSDESVSSIATFSSTSSISEELRYSSESLNHPYSNLSANIIRTSSVDGSEDNETDSPFKTRFDSLGEYAFPRTTGNRTLSEEKERFPGEMDKSLQSLTEGKEEHFLSNHGTAGRHNSLPLYNSSASIHPQHDSRSQSQSVLDPTLFTNPRVSPRPPTSPPISIARSHSFGNPASPSHSSLRSPSNPPHFLGSSRPHSSGTFSTASSNASTNTRPWVRDSDASSICSTGSGSYWSDQTTDAEVLKVGADGIECE